VAPTWRRASVGAMAEVTIRIRRNGPLLLTGPVELSDHEGRPLRVEGENIALCRCGRSSRKPFCDGTHRGVDFDGTLDADAYL
jgi:CDGSH-type Zn-finger protein